MPGAEWRLLLPLLLLIREYFVYFFDSKNIHIDSLQVNWGEVQKDRDNQKLAWRYPIALANRMYIFPVVLTLYLVYLIVQQTGLFGWNYSILFLVLDEQLLLVLTIVG